MWMWVIIIIELLAIPLGIWMHFLSKKSRSFKICSILLIVLGPIAAVITTYLSFAKNPFSQNVGVLTPKYQKSYKQDDAKISLYGGTSQIYTIRMKDNVVVQPFGRNVPFSLERTKKGLLISMVMRSVDGKVVAKMIRNTWHLLNPNNRLNFDAHALEVIDDYDIPMLQIEYLDVITLRIGGVFFAELANTSDIYPDFPSVPDNVGEIALYKLGANGMIILGKGTMVTREKPRDLSEVEEIRAIAKSSIKPWFDYSDPEKIGIRKKQEANESVTINKSDRKKYSKLTNEQLKAKASTFVRDLRELLSMCDKESESAWAMFKSSGDSNALRTFSSDECRKRTEMEYNRRFKIDAIILREEIISRTTNYSADGLPYSFYENSVNLFVCGDIANDLEKLANNL